ncbi:MAG: pilus assembly protein PilM [Lachnospiraceae bacterium]|nr:pilus assembly protein PilM [Lachnospiraceae bacterium]
MAKKILGVDIGSDNLKLALVQGRQVLATVSVPMPKNMVRDGHIASGESMSEMIRDAMKANKLRAGAAAYVIPNENVYVKNVVMPQMTADQLVYNLPFEFRDYISGEIREYVFDYAMLTGPGRIRGRAQDEEEAPTMELLAVSAPKAYIEEVRGIMRSAGLKLAKAAPAICAYINLIRACEAQEGAGPDEYCILDLGYQSIRMYMFQGERHMVTRVMDTGLSALDEVLADLFSVDIHLAHTYLMTNYENCQNREECLGAFDSIAMELMRVLNFYRYSNPDSNIQDIWLCGGGTMIAPLREAIRSILDMQVHPASNLVPSGGEIENCNSFVQAIGIAID